MCCCHKIYCGLFKNKILQHFPERIALAQHLQSFKVVFCIRWMDGQIKICIRWITHMCIVGQVAAAILVESRKFMIVGCVQGALKRDFRKANDQYTWLNCVFYQCRHLRIQTLQIGWRICSMHTEADGVNVLQPFVSDHLRGGVPCFIQLACMQL